MKMILPRKAHAMIERHSPPNSINHIQNDFNLIPMMRHCDFVPSINHSLLRPVAVAVMITFTIFCVFLLAPANGIGIRRRAKKVRKEAAIDSDGQQLHPLHVDHPHFQKMYKLNPGHALMFKRLASESHVSKNAGIGEVLLQMYVSPCGTGLEIAKNGTFLNAGCINEVFKEVKQKLLPETFTLAAYNFVGHKFSTMMRDEPWIKSLAFLMTATTGFLRQELERIYIPKFSSTYDKIIGNNAFRPTAVHTLRYMKSKGGLLAIDFIEIVGQVAPYISSPCKLIPNAGISFIAEIEFPLGEWCKYAVEFIVMSVAQMLKVEIGKWSVKAVIEKKKNMEAVGPNDPLRCFNMKTLSKLLTGKISTWYTPFVGHECDFFKPLREKDPKSTVFSQEGIEDEDLIKKFKQCQDGTTDLHAGKSKTPKIDLHSDDEEEKKELRANHALTRELEEDQGTNPDNKEEAKEPEPATVEVTCDTVIKDFMSSQLPPHLRNSEIVKYALLTMIDRVFDKHEDHIRFRIKQMVHFFNVASGLADPIKPGMCCSRENEDTKKECCGLDTQKHCDSRSECVWYRVKENSPEFQKIIKAYPTGKDKPQSYTLTCPEKVGKVKVAKHCKPISAWSRMKVSQKHAREPGQLWGVCQYFCQRNIRFGMSNENCAAVSVYFWREDDPGICDSDYLMVRAANACRRPIVQKHCNNPSKWICSSNSRKMTAATYLFGLIPLDGGRNNMCKRFQPGVSRHDSTKQQTKSTKISQLQVFHTIPENAADAEKRKVQPVNPRVSPTVPEAFKK